MVRAFYKIGRAVHAAAGKSVLADAEILRGLFCRPMLAHLSIVLSAARQNSNASASTHTLCRQTFFTNHLFERCDRSQLIEDDSIQSH
jgi:hypothetical protein